MKRAGIYTVMSFAAAVALMGATAGQASAQLRSDPTVPAGTLIINNGYYGDITNNGDGNTNNIHIGNGQGGTQGGAGITQGGTNNTQSAQKGGTNNTQGGTQSGTNNVLGGTQGGTRNTDTQGGTQGGTNNTQGGTQSGTRNTQGGTQSGTNNTQGAIQGSAQSITEATHKIIEDTYGMLDERIMTPLS